MLAEGQGQAANLMAALMKGHTHYVAASYDPVTGKLGAFWLVTFTHTDRYQSGGIIKVNGKEYILGKRGVDEGTIVYYELFLKAEGIEL